MVQGGRPLRPAKKVLISGEKGWWRGTELNCRHHDFQSCALPTELPRHRENAALGRARPMLPARLWAVNQTGAAPRLSPRRCRARTRTARAPVLPLSLIHISEPTRLGMISYAVFCLK